MENFITLIVNTLRNISIWSVVDILVVAYIFYKGYMLIRETRAEQLLKGIVLIIVLIPISYLLRLEMLYYILNKTLTIGVLAIIIIFQPEIRRALEHLGRTAFEEMHSIQDKEERNNSVNEIVNAVSNLAEEKVGALIAIEQSTGIGEIISSGTILDANISCEFIRKFICS